MHKVLIVDDETIFRKGLHTMITSWQDDWEIVGEARDGYEALDLLDRFRPDVVLTDIRMPRMDGIQFQRIAKERFPNLICIVLSGYDEFSYVQQSLRQGARDYITKPIEREELHKVLAQVKLELERKPKEVAATPNLNELNDEHHMRQHIIEMLITGFLRGDVHDKYIELLKRIGIHFDLNYYTCLVIKLDKDSVDSARYNQADPSLFQLYIQQFVQEILSHQMRVFSFVLSDTDVIALVNLPDQHVAKVKLSEKTESIRKQIKSLSNMTVTIGVGQVVEGIEAIPKSYNEAEIALLYRLIIGGNKVLEYDELTKESLVKGDMTKWSWESLESFINEGDKHGTSRRLETMIHDLCIHASTPEAVHQHMCKLLIHFYEIAEELGVTKQWLDKDIRHVLFDICSISSREELIEACHTLFDRLTDCISAETQDRIQDPLDISLRYLQRHFHEPISLKTVADIVYLNPAYLSSLFRQKTGKTFVEHLTKVRIEEAKKKLLYTDDKVTVIAAHTGFINVRHFHRVFKTATGFSPNDFRKYAQRNHQ